MTRPADDAAWIFQAQPKEWDIDRFLRDVASGQVGADTAWLVTRYADRVQVGDPVFIWRTGGREQGGIVARATITGPVAELPDDLPRYRLPDATAKSDGPRPRAPIHIERVLTKRVSQVQVQFAPGLEELSILRWARQQTNYPVTSDELARLDALCEGR